MMTRDGGLGTRLAQSTTPLPNRDVAKNAVQHRCGATAACSSTARTMQGRATMGSKDQTNRGGGWIGEACGTWHAELQ